MKRLTNSSVLKVIERVLVAGLLGYRKLRYGYAFRRIRLAQPRYAIVDPEDYDELRQYEWFAMSNRQKFYAVRLVLTGGPKRSTLVSMHRQIINVEDGLVVDHINHEAMDNRRANLRPATRSQNARHRKKCAQPTSSKYKGPAWEKGMDKWVARICVDGKSMHLGYFTKEIEAAKAYDEAAKKYHGEFAALNFPE